MVARFSIDCPSSVSMLYAVVTLFKQLPSKYLESGILYSWLVEIHWFAIVEIRI
jgi:hypothetical protein